MSKQKRRLGQGQGVHTFVHQQQVRIAPLPQPEELAQFEQVLPGLANRIVTMAEGNARDRWRTNRTVRFAAILGQLFAFVLVMSALAGGFYLALNDRETAGLTTIITAIAVPAGAFIYRVRKG